MTIWRQLTPYLENHDSTEQDAHAAFLSRFHAGIPRAAICRRGPRLHFQPGSGSVFRYVYEHGYFMRNPTSHPCSLTQEAYCGWKALRLSNGLVDLYVVPEIGGRVIQLRFGGQDFFYVNPRHQGRVYSPDENSAAAGWKNYGGSKVWPAPQGWTGADEWPGPPDPVLDGGVYGRRVVEEAPRSAALYLESPPDAYTGLTFSREIRIFENDPVIRMVHTMRNTSSRRVRWAVWQVTQHAVSPSLAVYAPARRARQIYGDKTFERARLDGGGDLWKLEYANQVAKFALEMARGRIVSVNGEAALIEEFSIFPGEPYPGDSQAQVWVNGEGAYTIATGKEGQSRRIDMSADLNGCDPFVETEILSPLVDLAPGEDYVFPLTWRLARVTDGAPP